MVPNFLDDKDQEVLDEVIPSLELYTTREGKLEAGYPLGAR